MSKNFPIFSESISALKYKKDHNICKYRFRAPLYSHGRTRIVEQSFFTQDQVEKIPKIKY